MSGTQLRRYEVKPGELSAFLAGWRGLVPIRERFGFRVLFAFSSEDESEFVWAVRHDGDFAEAERAYYADPERNTVGAGVTPHLAATHVSMVDAVEP
jgi:hypothetical protein